MAHNHFDGVALRNGVDGDRRFNSKLNIIRDETPIHRQWESRQVTRDSNLIEVANQVPCLLYIWPEQENQFVQVGKHDVDFKP